MFASTSKKTAQCNDTQSTAEDKTYLKKRPFPKDENYNLEIKMQNALAKMMKIKADNDSHNNELQQKIQTLESSKEKQRMEICLLYSQNEKLCIELQNEVNQRNEILHKDNRTREVLDILKEHANVIGKILNQCQVDRQKLSERYQQAVDFLVQLKADHNRDEQQFETELKNIQKQLESEKQLRSELSKNWDDRNRKTDEYINHLKNQNASLEGVLANLKLEKDTFIIREKEYQDNISHLTAHGKQKEQLILTMQSDFKNIYEKLSQEKNDLSEKGVENKNRIFQLEDQLEESKITIKKQDADSKTYQEEISDLKEKIELTETESTEINALNEEKLSDLQKQKDMLDKNNLNLINDKIALERQMLVLKEDLEEDKIFIEEKCSEMFSLQEKVETLEKEFNVRKSERENEKASLQADFRMKLKDTALSHDEEIKKYEENISNLQQNLGTKSTKIIELISELGLVNEKYKESEKNLEISKEEMRILREYTKNNHEDIDNLNEKLREAENMYSDVVSELLELKQKTTKNPKISVDLNDNHATSAFDSLLKEQEKVTTTRNSVIQVENNVEETPKRQKIKLFSNIEDGFTFFNDCVASYKIDQDQIMNDFNKGCKKSLTQLKVSSIKEIKDKVSATQKKSVTSTNKLDTKTRKLSKPKNMNSSTRKSKNFQNE